MYPFVKKKKKIRRLIPLKGFMDLVVISQA